MGEKTTEKVSTVLTPDDKAKLKQMAHDDNRNVSDFVRVLVLTEIAQWEAAKKMSVAK